MSTEAPRRRFDLLLLIMADKDLSSSAKCAATVLLLKFLNDKTGRCNPSYDTLADQLGRHRRATITAVAELREAGWVAVEDGTSGRGPGSTNKLTFDFGRLDDAIRVQSTAPQAGRKRVQSTALLDGLRVQSTARTGAVHCTRTNENQPSSRRDDDGEDRASARAPDGAARGEGQFDRFWHHFPLQVDRKSALTEFRRVVDTGMASAEELIEGAAQYASSRDGEDPKFTQRPANWLKNERWHDRPAPPRSSQGRRGGKQDPAAAMMEYGHRSEEALR